MKSHERKRILIVEAPFKWFYHTGVPDWLLGGNPPEGLPDIIYTLREFGKHGYEVHISLPVWGRMYPCREVIREGSIIVHPYRIPGVFLPLVRLLIRKGNVVLNWIFVILTMVFGFDFNRRLIARLKPTFLYQMGYTTLLGHFLHRISNVPLVYRLFGTTVTRRLRSSGFPLSLFHLLRHAPEVFIYRHPFSLMVQTNDGSAGGKTMSAFGIPLSKQFFTVNGVNLHNQQKAVINIREGLPKGVFLAVTIAHLVEWKGIDRTIRAFPEAIRLNPKLRMAIIGDGDQRKELERLAKTLGVEDHVKFHGVIPNATVIDTLRQADVFISTINCPQNLPNTMLESITAGCNVISLADGSLDGFLEDGKNAILLNPDRVEEELPGALERLAKDKTFNKCLSVGIERKRKEIWSWTKRIIKELEAIERAIDKQ
jgi:glycosyltransferase involved in cell wall biosynthesis